MKLAIVDYDGTLFKEETIPYLLGLAKNGIVPKKDYLLSWMRVFAVVLIYKSGLNKKFDKEKFHHEAAKAFLSIFKNMKKDDIEKFFKKAALEAEKLLNPVVLAEVQRLKLEGYHLVLLSGGFYPYVKLVGEKLKFDDIFATKLEYAEKGFDLKKEMKFITGKNKKETLLKEFPKEANVDWEASYSYADSYFDSDVLELTGQPHAVNPDAKLNQLALDKGWAIIKHY